MERFTITRVNNDDVTANNGTAEVVLNVNEINMRKNSHTVPVTSPDRRKFSFAQLTRYENNLIKNL